LSPFERLVCYTCLGAACNLQALVLQLHIKVTTNKLKKMIWGIKINLQKGVTQYTYLKKKVISPEVHNLPKKLVANKN
jgi:hypothetical protein